MFIDFHHVRHHFAREVEIHIAAQNHGTPHQRGYNTYNLTDTVGNVGGDKVDYIIGQVQTVLLCLAAEHIASQLHIGALQFLSHAPFESVEHTSFEALHLRRRTIAREYNLFAVLFQMIEYVEEHILGFSLTGQLLHVVHNKHVDALIEVEERVDGSHAVGSGKLTFEQTRVYI